MTAARNRCPRLPLKAALRHLEQVVACTTHIALTEVHDCTRPHVHMIRETACCRPTLVTCLLICKSDAIHVLKMFHKLVALPTHAQQVYSSLVMLGRA